MSNDSGRESPTLWPGVTRFEPKGAAMHRAFPLLILFATCTCVFAASGRSRTILPAGWRLSAPPHEVAGTLAQRAYVGLAGAFGTPVPGAGTWAAAVSLSPDGAYLAFSDDATGQAGIIDVASGAVARRVPTRQHPRAVAMYDAFTGEANLAPFSAIRPGVDLRGLNTKSAYGAAQSARMGFEHADAANPRALNAILYRAAREGPR